MIELVVVRHGETIENTKGICQGQTHGTLSEKGKKQNILLAKELSSLEIHKIYSSPLRRALDTAKEIHQFHDIDLEVRDNLSEWYLGSLQGKNFPLDFDITKLPDDMENAGLVKKRLQKLLNEIKTNHNNETILFVSHGLTIKVLISILEKLPMNNVNKVNLMKNSDYKMFTIF
jgi:broad specificity phosphatase PhoE